MKISPTFGPYHQGQQISHLKVEGPFFRLPFENRKGGCWYAVCRCSCGAAHLATTTGWSWKLAHNQPISCGHRKSERFRNPDTVPGYVRRMTAWGETKSLKAWSRDPRCQLSYSGLLYRLRQNIPFTEALTVPK
jgi:hypothetical protein